MHRLTYFTAVRSKYIALIEIWFFSKEKRSEKSDKNEQKFAPPGNRTRVARMGILHDTTTPAAPQYVAVNFIYLNMAMNSLYREMVKWTVLR